MVMLSKEGCPACEYMEDVVFAEQAVEDTINKNFIPVHLDIHKDKIPPRIGIHRYTDVSFCQCQGRKVETF